MLHAGGRTSRVDVTHTFLSIDTQDDYDLVPADSNKFCYRSYAAAGQL